jgi:serine protease inhibitor
MRWQRVLGALVPVVLAAMLAACTGTGSSPVTAPTVARGVAYTEPAASPAPYGAADTAFGLDVLRTWCQADPGASLVFSPAVLASALGMAYLGAKGPTATAMAAVLHLPAQSRAALLAGLAARLAALRAANGAGVTLAASDFAWADPSLPPLKSYLDDVATGYDAGVGEAPFQADPQRAASQVNQAISQDTRGQIPQLLTPGLVAGIGWVLTAALYMDARWAAPFDPAQDTSAPFTLADGGQVTARYMNSGPLDGLRAGIMSGWTAVSLPYQGGKVTMLALLPPPKSGTCALPTAQVLTAIGTQTGAFPQAVGAGGVGVAVNGFQVSMPKISLSASASVNDELKALGMSLAFTGSADFTGLSPQAAQLGFVQQAATLKVDEKGTVGAAAAAVGVEPAAAAVPPPTLVDFNRPYLLLVTDTQTGEPLFLAKVANPLER